MAAEKPELAVNRGAETVAEALNGFVSHAATGFVGGTHLDIATAYFNVGGYSLLADSLDRTTGVRLLLGAEPTPPENRRRALRTESAHPQRALRTRLRQALDGHERDILTDRDLLGFSIENDAAARRLVEWLKAGKVEVRRLEGRFLHGKAFLIGDRSHGVVAGSSNFTYAGLATNLELNLGNYTPHVVTQVQQWFDELWDEADPYDLAALFETRFKPHSPQLVYLKMLWEFYGEELEIEADAEGAPQIHLTSFQSDGLFRARRILQEHNGVLIADEVGLGKTFLAGELIREAALERRQRVLVITPATLRDGPWKAFRRDHILPIELRSYEEVMGDHRLNPEHKGPLATTLESEKDDYALIVIDEAHNLRNPSTQRASALRELLKGSPPKQLVMLTATPVNNSLWDLYHLLGYFLRNDAVFADAGIRSLRDHFAAAMAQDPENLTPEHLFDVLDTVAVRRTRSFVKRFYPNDTIKVNGKNQQIIFPTPRVRKVAYDLDAVLPGFFNQFEHALNPQADVDDPDVLTLARYAPSQYRLDNQVDAYEIQLAGLLRSGLLKRFESSSHAFAETCERMAKTHDAFLSLLENGHIATGEVLADWIAADSDDLDSEALDSYFGHHVGPTDKAGGYDTDRLREHVDRDRNLLRTFAQQARSVTRADDPKLAAVVEELASIAGEAATEKPGLATERNRRKALIFSYFADTVDWIFEHLQNVAASDERLAPYRGRIAHLTGNTGESKENVLWGFAPQTTDAPAGANDDRYDIVVSTDVLAEGVNLQQARHIINYDLPWNPMRLVQRHGRIDRIGSKHAEVHLRCVFPDARLDDLLGLEERLHSKLAQAAASVGVGEVLPEQTASAEINFSDTREEIERIRNEDPTLFERGGTSRGSLSGEEFRQELRQALEDSDLADQIKSLPWGSGSGMALNAPVGRVGYVFCARIGDHPRPLFRFVEAQRSGGDTVIGETLACLAMARPSNGFNTPRVLDDDTARGAFDAWQRAQVDIIEKWNFMSDKANLEPKMSPRLLRAAEVLREHPPPESTQDEIDRALDAICAPYPERTIRIFGAAMKKTDDLAEQATEILNVIRALGLEPYIPPEPLPEITAEDVHLVTWLALV
ncbi:MAG: phospholipase D-like domain-containing protein [Acidimicrobiaceae bacterium]|nr:phospholipase D-like domain-containing protein [Acidimicrobiaceae bacterium]